MHADKLILMQGQQLQTFYQVLPKISAKIVSHITFVIK
jgi:hypothetical protein